MNLDSTLESLTHSISHNLPQVQKSFSSKILRQKSYL